MYNNSYSNLPYKLLFAGLEPILSHTEKSCITSYYRQFYKYTKLKIIKY